MYKNRSRGFTLIELLVVIAIIGILSAVVLASLNTARSKGQDAAVQSNMNTVQVQSELYYGNNSNAYDTGTHTAVTSGLTNCTANGSFADPTIKGALTGAYNAGQGGIACVNQGTYYAVAVEMRTTTGYWCVDSTGKSESVPSGAPTFSTTGPVLCP